MKIPLISPGDTFRIFPSELERVFSEQDSIHEMVRRQAALLNRRLAVLTEQYLRQAVEQGPGWNLWRAGPCLDEGDPGFCPRYKFQLIAPGSDEELEQPGVLFVQPTLTEGERARLLAGRHDWQEDRWQDHCGVLDCGHSCCEDYRL